jgi:hypothetical protein
MTELTETEITEPRKNRGNRSSMYCIKDLNS